MGRRSKGYFKNSSGKHRVFKKVNLGISYNITDKEMEYILDGAKLSIHGVKCNCGWNSNILHWYQVNHCPVCGNKMFNQSEKEVLDKFEVVNKPDKFIYMTMDSSMKIKTEKGIV